ncbi:TolC family protein [Robertkochia solimangrovi]|uniref:TolC family protein n=1 Tax=Robertkochia solimangrovi TaxID=2213046 RepID=UPI0011809F2F|nr:TolC family protein [Robertkochia solimangrovi]TRZ41275.1 TolC family protein [Robertkochia solimangrovi]
MIKKSLYISFVSILSLCATYGQDLLSTEDAVSRVLEENFSIKLARNNVEAGELGVSAGYAGMLPTVSAVVTDNNRILNMEQTRSDGTVNKLDNARNNSLNYGVAMDWTIFDGFEMFARYDELEANKNFNTAELKVSVLTTVNDVLVTYYNLVQIQQQLSALDSSLVISRQRLELAENRFSIGKASKLEVLNAKVDINTDQTLYLQQQELYKNSKIRLNELLVRELSTEFKVEDSIHVDPALMLPELKSIAMEQNPNLVMQQINQRIAELQLKQIKAQRYPEVALTGGYDFSETESSLGFTTSSSSRGWNYGFRVSLNVFDGFNQNRNEKIARIQVDNSKLVLAEQEQSLMSQLESTYQTYQTNLGLIDLERENVDIARENLNITIEKFRIGTITTLEFRTAQLNYINAQLRLNEAVFQAKISEVALKALTGDLSI